MCTEKICDDTILDHPVSYYIKNFNNQNVQIELFKLRLVDSDLYQYICRLHFIYSISNKEPINQCPVCGGEIITDEWGEEYCNQCGLVTRTHYDYAAGVKIFLDFGLK